jgi:predicted transcriptional regulator
MSEEKQEVRLELLQITSKVVAAQVQGRDVTSKELNEMFQVAFDAVSGIYFSEEAVGQERPEPAVPIEDSIQGEYIVCLEDGKKMKMMRRHLMTAYGMTPDEYRERWGLSADYPMTSPEYSKRRSGLAKQIGLGKHRKKG